MLSKKKKAELDAILSKSHSSFGSNFYRVYWHMHDWSRKKRVEDDWSDITTDHLKLIHLIAQGESMTNGELAKQAGVTKQAMSQMVTLLEKRGALVVEQDPNDSRAKLISLADYGVDFMIYFQSQSQQLYKMYKEILGEEKMRILTELSGELARGLPDLGGTDDKGKKRFSNAR